MTRTLFLALILPILLAECFAAFVAHDQAWVDVFALLGLGVLAVRWFLGPQEADERCSPDCPKCAESLTGDER